MQYHSEGRFLFRTQQSHKVTCMATCLGDPRGLVFHLCPRKKRDPRWRLKGKLLPLGYLLIMLALMLHVCKLYVSPPTPLRAPLSSMNH